MCKLAALAQNAAQQNFMLVILSANLIINTKQLTTTARTAHMKLCQLQNMRDHLSRLQMKILIIPANQTSINYENVFTGVFSEVVIVGCVSDAQLAGSYQKNQFNFQNCYVNRIEIMARPS